MRLEISELKSYMEEHFPKSTYIDFGIDKMEYDMPKRRLQITLAHYKRGSPEFIFTFKDVQGYSLIQEIFFQGDNFEWLGLLGVSKESSFTKFIAPEKSYPLEMLNLRSFRVLSQNNIMDVVCREEIEIKIND
ncbi:hypothetical protein [Pedobacter roseus]|uniref:Uncharacterized protein n=1 Tax=Pedobacter roseus TaxID=336820 RepID=A0A7G9QGA8_9SPHI|nr:hypothetical protein [Pedobacter roseus]QNN42383.1 hypothetical protein H9L23_25465 [Pedobacter roseus]